MILMGKQVNLIPMTKKDISIFYNWVTNSDGGYFWYGEFYGTNIPSLEEFLEDWKPYYFNNNQPLEGRCYNIMVNDRAIGQVNYNTIDPVEKSTELDIIIANSGDQGKGYGPDALLTLSRYLFKKFKISYVWIASLHKNIRACKSYEKAGFVKTDPPPQALNDEVGWPKSDILNWSFYRFYNKKENHKKAVEKENNGL